MNSFSGNPFEIGRQIGEYYARHGVDFAPVTHPDLLRRQLRYHEAFAPEIIEELRGVAAGGNFAFDALAHERLVTEILYFREVAAKSCSIGGFTDQSGQAWVARNYDWHPLVAEHFQAWKFRLPEVNVVAVSDMCISVPADIDKREQRFVYHDAINSHGLFIGLTYAHCAATAIGLATGDMIKLAAWRCKTVDEALKLFSNVKLSCPKNFFLADAGGKMAVVEHAVEDMHIRLPDAEGVLVLTNHYAQHLNVFDLISRESTTFDRYSRLQKELRALRHSKNVDFAQLDRIMSDPASPVCQFFPDQQIETVWTLLLNVTASNYRLIRDPRSSHRRVTDFSI